MSEIKSLEDADKFIESGWKNYTKIRCFYNEGNPNNAIYHIRGVVDDQLVVRQWFKGRKSYHYDLITRYWQNANFGNITFEK